VTNKEYVSGLRKIADFFEERPSLKVPSSLQFDVWCDDREEMIEAAKIAGTTEKIWQGDWLYLRKSFADHVSVDFNLRRNALCEKVSKGMKSVPETIIPAKPEEIIPAHEVEEFEWKCPESLLAES
jgi:hypothetical protein